MPTIVLDVSDARARIVLPLPEGRQRERADDGAERLCGCGPDGADHPCMAEPSVVRDVLTAARDDRAHSATADDERSLSWTRLELHHLMWSRAQPGGLVFEEALRYDELVAAEATILRRKMSMTAAV